MAASDKNIVISPQRGSATQSPSIRFVGDGNDPISIYALDGVPGSLSIEGSAGQLFSLTNNLTSGSIFSVNDVSGIPSIDVNANGQVQIAPFGGTLAIGQSVVTAGQTVDIKGNLRVDGTLTITSSANIANLNADFLDGLNSTQFLRSDTSGTLSGQLTLANAGPQLILDNSGQADPRWGMLSWTSGLNIYPIDAASTIFIGRDGQSTTVDLFNVSNVAVAGTNILNSSRQLSNVTFGGNTIWHAGNDGSGSGLDADLLDGVQGASFLRSDAADTWSGDLSTTSTNGIRFGSANQTDGNDGYIAAGRFASGLNIIGTQTTAGTGRQVRIWGSVIDSSSNAFWNAGNDGAGSGLDADLLDGIQASSFIRSDAATTATGTVTFSGTSSAPFRLVATNANASWDALTWQATNEWGDTTSYGVLGGDGTEGFFIRRPHVVWNSGHGSADIRLGRSGGTSSGAWVNMGVKASNVGFIGYENSNVLTWNSSDVTAVNSSRAPIFYDSNDTGFYLDPASTSNLNRIYTTYNSASALANSTFNVSSSVIGGLHFTNGSGVSGSGNQAAITFMGSSSSQAQAGIYVHNNSSEGTHMAFCTTDSYATGPQIGLRIMNSGYSLFPRSYVESTGSFRAPIFYDSNNTGLYVDPASTSILNTLRLTSNNALYFSTTSTAQFEHDSNSTPVAFAMIKSGTSFSDGDSYGVLNLRRLNHTNSVANAGASLFFELKDSGGTVREYAGVTGRKTEAGAAGGQLDFHYYGRTVMANMNSSLFQHIGSVRAPIFYDSNNTGYYTDPASTSRLDNIHSNVGTFGSRINGSVFGGNTSGLSGVSQVLEVRANGSIPLMTWHYENIATRHIGLDSSGFLQVYNPNEGGGSVLQANSSLRAPIFYDSNDTAYYTDPNGYSRLNRLVLNQARIDASRFPVGHYATGDTVFEIDTAWTNDQLQAYFNSSNVSWVDDSTAPGGYAIQITGAVNVGGAYGSGFPFIPVDQDDIFYMEVWIKSVSGSNGHYMGSIDYNSSFGSLGGNPGSFGYWVMSNNAPGTAWTKYSGYITGFGNSTGQFKTGTEYFTPQALFNYSGGGTSYISGWKCIRTSHQGNRTIIGRSGSVVDNSTYALDVFHGTDYRQLRVRATSSPLIKLSGAYNGGNGAEIWQDASGNFRFNINGSSAAMRMVPGPYTEIYGSVSSPIFYDQNDTGYYLDPNSTSQLRAVQANDWFRPQNETGLYSQSYGQHFYPDAGGFYWEVDGPLRIRNGYEGAIQGYVGYHDSNGFGLLHSGGSWWLNTQNNDAHLVIGGSQQYNAFNSVTGRRLMFGGGDADAQSNYYIGTNLENYGGNYNKLDLRWHTGIRMGAQPNYGGIRFYDTEDLGTQVFAIGKDGSYAQANQSMRAPIFYDLDNTGYYLDPASTSNLYGVVSYSYQGNGNVGGTGSASWHPSGIYSAGYNWLYGGINAGGASVTNMSDARANIFYDNNDTGYYLDPNTTSDSALRIRGGALHGPNPTWGAYLLVGGDGRQNYINNGSTASVCATNGNLHLDAASGYATYINHYDGNVIYFGGGSNNNWGEWSGGILYSYSDTRSPIYYDYNDTGYYIDPNARRSTNINGFSARTKMTLGLTAKYQLDRADYTGDSNYWTGVMGWGATDMNSAFDWGCGFIDSWGDPANEPVGASHWVGTQALHYTNGSGRYGWQMVGGPIGNLRFRNVWGGGFSSWTTIAMHDRNDISGGALYAGSYYDSNDTSYYSDPNSTSRLNVIATNSITNYGQIDTGRSGTDSGMARSSYPYSFGFQESGGWSSPFPDLVLQYHTGVTLAANSSYDGISFKADYNDSTVIFRVNGGSNYLYKYRWMYTTSDGFYSDTNNAHWNPNASSSYGSWRMVGSRNGWTGIYFETGGNQINHLMFDGNNNGGFYSQNSGRWWQYYSYDNNCWGFGTSTTSPAYNIYCPTGVYSGGRVDGTIFYDSNNTGYYVDAASTSNLNSVSMQGGNVYGAMNFVSNQGPTSGSLSSPPLQAYSNSNNSAYMSFHKGGFYAVNFGLDSDNVLRIGGWSAAANRWQLDMSGNMTAAGNVTAYSDLRLKDNIEVIDNALEKVLRLRGVTFTRTDSEDKERRHAGVIAQEVEEVLPEVVQEQADGMKSVAYGNMAGLLIEAIKEQNKIIEELKKEVERLKSKLGE